MGGAVCSHFSCYLRPRSVQLSSWQYHTLPPPFFPNPTDLLSKPKDVWLRIILWRYTIQADQRSLDIKRLRDSFPISHAHSSYEKQQVCSESCRVRFERDCKSALPRLHSISVCLITNSAAKTLSAEGLFHILFLICKTPNSTWTLRKKIKLFVCVSRGHTGTRSFTLRKKLCKNYFSGPLSPTLELKTSRFRPLVFLISSV